MKFIAVLLLVAFLAGLIRCQEIEHDVTIESRSNQRPSLFLCDYYVKHIRRAKLDKSMKTPKHGSMIGRIRLSCEDPRSVRREVLSIFRAAGQPESSGDLIKSNYVTFDRQDSR